MKLSVIIPTYKRESLLLWHLRELSKQTLKQDLFEVLVVSDGVEFSSWFREEVKKLPTGYSLRTFVQEKAGPAAARNVGAAESTGDVLVFLGDDCIPDRNLLFRHYQAHLLSYDPIAIQGYTLWHPRIPPDEFMNFLTGEGGIQANWKSLKKADGTWKREANGWFMTTNTSVERIEFFAELGFNEEFPYAAWEDIELGIRFIKRGLNTIFLPDAINYHFHKITVDSYIQRQIREGKSRVILCRAHPEMASNFISPEGLREMDRSQLSVAIQDAKDVLYLHGEDTLPLKYKRWQTALQMASIEGLHLGIEENKRYWQVLKHVHLEEELRYAAGACAFLDNNELGYANFEGEWAVLTRKDNWALHALMGEVSIALGDKISAGLHFRDAINLGPGEKWPLDGLKEVSK